MRAAGRLAAPGHELGGALTRHELPALGQDAGVDSLGQLQPAGRLLELPERCALPGAEVG